ncbi:MAG: hypothetical protein B7X40_10575 [Cellulomonas sp. 14-74-6]|nr:MAG: hypothetical protein B7X40_10575 [Cellulomonas sp. 14-74-6]
MLQQRQLTDTVADPATRKARVNLLNWDGKGAPEGMFPPRRDEARPHEPEGPSGETRPLPAGGSEPGPTGSGTEPR